MTTLSAIYMISLHALVFGFVATVIITDVKERLAKDKK